MRLSKRDIRLDGLRGLLLVIMAGVHVPTPLSHWLQEPFGFTSAAEGFLFLGGLLAGRVYGAVYSDSGWAAMARRVWNRAKTVYLVHLMVASIALVIAWGFAASLPPLAEHFHDSLAHPLDRLVLTALLLHQPPLFDILPLYVVFLCLTPWLFGTARRHGWTKILAVSALVWAFAQVESRFIGDFGRPFDLRLGSFNLLAWQFLWVGGLALGESLLRGPVLRRGQHRGLVAAAGVIVVAGFVCRHGLWPQAWFPPELYLWMDKWTLGPLRLLNFSSWVVVLLWWNPQVPSKLMAPLALLGRNSLSVFAFHLPLVIAATTAVELFTISYARQVLIGVCVIAALFPWAAWQDYNRRRAVRSAPAAPAPVPAETLQPVTEELAGLLTGRLETPEPQN